MSMSIKKEVVMRWIVKNIPQDVYGYNIRRSLDVKAVNRYPFKTHSAALKWADENGYAIQITNKSKPHLEKNNE